MKKGKGRRGWKSMDRRSRSRRLSRGPRQTFSARAPRWNFKARSVRSPRGSTSAPRAAPDRDFARSRRTIPWTFFVFHVSATANLLGEPVNPAHEGFRISWNCRTRKRPSSSCNPLFIISLTRIISVYALVMRRKARGVDEILRKEGKF